MAARPTANCLFDDAFIRRLHKRLFGNVWSWASEYRLREKNIGIDPVQISIQLRMLLDDGRFPAGHNVYPPLESLTPTSRR